MRRLSGNRFRLVCLAFKIPRHHIVDGVAQRNSESAKKIGVGHGKYQRPTSLSEHLLRMRIDGISGGKVYIQEAETTSAANGITSPKRVGPHTTNVEDADHAKGVAVYLMSQRVDDFAGPNHV